jgi:thymidylate synthase
LFTTTKIFLHEIIEEFLWSIKGTTDSTFQKGAMGMGFFEKQGPGHRRTGDLGPVHGFQWRHFGAEYVGADTDYSGKGVDQLREVILKIIEEPTDRLSCLMH